MTQTTRRTRATTTASRAPRVDVGWSGLGVLGGLLCGAVVLLDLARAVDDTLVRVLVVLVAALALDRPVGLVERWSGLPRAGAVAAVVSGVLAAAGALALLLGPAVVAQTRVLREDAPRVLDELARLPVVGRSLEENDVPAQLQRALDALPDRLAGDAQGLAGTVAVQLAGTVQSLLLLVLLLAEGPALVAAAQRLLPPRWRSTAGDLGRSVLVVVGRYAVGSAVLALMAGTAAFAIALVLGVPLAGVAALWALLWNFVPQLGGVVGGAVLVALALTTGPGTAGAALLAWLVYTQLENRVVQPVVVGRAVHLSPLTTLLVALLGVAVAGLLGAVLAVPLAAAVQAARVELGSPRRSS